MRLALKAPALAVKAGVLLGCQTAPSRVISADQRLGVVDFRRYAEQGFVFTPDTYSGAHEPRGLVTAVHYARGVNHGDGWRFEHINWCTQEYCICGSAKPSF
jgi:hypothetical protein